MKTVTRADFLDSGDNFTGFAGRWGTRGGWEEARALEAQGSEEATRGEPSAGIWAGGAGPLLHGAENPGSPCRVPDTVSGRLFPAGDGDGQARSPEAQACTAGAALLSRRREGEGSLHWVSDIPRDSVIPVSENFVFLVKLPFVFADGHRKPFLFKIRLLFFSNGCFF